MLSYFHHPLAQPAAFPTGEEAPSVEAFPCPGLKVDFLILGI